MSPNHAALLGFVVIGAVMVVITIGRALGSSIREVTKWENRSADRHYQTEKRPRR